MGPRVRGDDGRFARDPNGLLCMNTNPKSTSAASPNEDVHLIVVEDEEIVIEHHPEDWMAFVLFWALASIVFLQFFTRYIMTVSYTHLTLPTKRIV